MSPVLPAAVSPTAPRLARTSMSTRDSGRAGCAVGGASYTSSITGAHHDRLITAGNVSLRFLNPRLHSTASSALNHIVCPEPWLQHERYLRGLELSGDAAHVLCPFWGKTRRRAYSAQWWSVRTSLCLVRRWSKSPEAYYTYYARGL
jgi:hypothetical protein